MIIIILYPICIAYRFCKGTQLLLYCPILSGERWIVSLAVFVNCAVLYQWKMLVVINCAFWPTPYDARLKCAHHGNMTNKATAIIFFLSLSLKNVSRFHPQFFFSKLFNNCSGNIYIDATTGVLFVMYIATMQ